MAHGMHTKDWLRLLRRHRHEIDPKRWPRLLFVTGMTVLNSAISNLENRIFENRIMETNIRSPLFILGHWRSGTTLLHNLLACDSKFAAPTLLQTLYPNSFLLLGPSLSLFRSLLPSTRIIDNVRFDFDQPQEDEFAICNATLLSPYTGWIFPGCQDYYDRYSTLSDVPDEEVAKWRQSFVHFLRKVSWLSDRPLILKSPTHTGRIRLLLSLFPDARFVHISRNPYHVFQSNKHLHQVMWRAMAVQRTDVVESKLNEFILLRYQALYERFFYERTLIPDGSFCELKFEDLIADPIISMERLYNELRIEGVDLVRPFWQHHFETLGEYNMNTYPPIPEELKRRIRKSWHRSFEEWDYDEE